jgi:hypothetical protein
MKGGITMRSLLKSHAKKGGVVTNTVVGVGGLIIAIILIAVVVQTIVNANLLTAESIEDNATDRLRGNWSDGIDNVSGKIPTILLIIAVVFLFGALVLLVRQAKEMGFGDASGSL